MTPHAADVFSAQVTCDHPAPSGSASAPVRVLKAVSNPSKVSGWYLGNSLPTYILTEPNLSPKFVSLAVSLSWLRTDNLLLLSH